MPDLSSLMGMLGGAAGGGGGGMPDIASLMNNPQMMAMAQNLMQSGALEGLMSNPRMRDMANNYMQNGQMPDTNELMNDPEIADMARNFGAGRGGDGAGGANGDA